MDFERGVVRMKLDLIEEHVVEQQFAFAID
jgi:hypothetical protein